MKSTDTFLSLVKSTTTYVSNFIGNTADPCFTKGLVLSSPTIYKTGSSFYFDYSSSANSSDLKFLYKFFGSLAIGTTFAATGGTYYYEPSGTQYNFAGVYSLAGKTGLYNQYLNFVGVTYSSSLVDGTYFDENFLTPLNFTAVTGGTCQCFISQVNKQDPFNLNFLGLYGDDYGYEEYLQIPESSTNPARYKIDNSLKLNDGSEIIYIDNTTPITSENRYFNQSTLNIYMRGVPDLATLAANTSLNGLLKKVDTLGNTIQIYDNQNLRQRYCRGVGSTYYFDWFGMHPGSNFENVYNPIAYDGLSISINYFSFVQLETILIYNSIVSDSPQYNTTLGLVVDGVGTSTATYSSSPQVSNPVLKIDLSDSSLYSTTVEPFIDAACSVPLAESYFLNGVPGFDGASFIYLKTESMPSVIYLKFKKGIELILQINIQG